MIVMEEMLKVFQQHRGNAIVVSGRANRHWDQISTIKQRDLSLGDPAMGGHAAFALGLALAQPNQKVVVFDSEGDLQMSLGVLAMIAEQKPKNFYHFLLDNECYATTGGQPVPNAKVMAYDAIAKGCGYPTAYAYNNLESFSVNVGRILSEAGPTLVAMKILPEIENTPIGQRTPRLKRTKEQGIADLRAELGVCN
jgi:thiamine pyrophosphate-dependent acetolactate synthase large subunit-like protein